MKRSFSTLSQFNYFTVDGGPTLSEQAIPAKTRLAILNNILPPYRAPIYRTLGLNFETLILLSGREDNRQWTEPVLGDVLRIKHTWGFTVRKTVQQRRGRTSDIRYFHLNPGYIRDLLAFHPHAIISTEMGFRSVIATIYGIVFRVPVWIWWGGTLHSERSRSGIKRAIRRCFFAPLTGRWISYSEASSAYLNSIGVRENRILQIQNCVDDELYARHTEPFHLELPRPRALFVGQLIGRKGVSELLRAVSIVQNRGLKFSLLIVGDGPEANYFDREVQRLHLENVQRIQYVDPESMPAVYRACDFLVFPTLEDIWGLVVNEAILAGIPVMSSKFAGSSRELLDDSSIFDPHCMEEFAALLTRAVQGGLKPPDRSRMLSEREVADRIIEDVKRRTCVRSMIRSTEA